MHTCRYRISLRLRHDSADLSACASRFGLEPSRQRQAGRQRTTPLGESLPGRWSDSYWTAALPVPPDESLEGALWRIAGWLDGHARFLADHRATGGSVSLFIGLFLEGPSAGFALPPALMRRYASPGVALEFDVYGTD